MAKTLTYHVADMRVTFPSAKVAAKNPNRFCTVHGTAFSGEKGDKLSIVSKNVTVEEAADPATVIDPQKGILTLPAGERGRKPVAGASASDVAAKLAALRKPKA